MLILLHLNTRFAWESPTNSKLFVKRKEHQQLSLQYFALSLCDLNSFTFLPAASTPIVCEDWPLHTFHSHFLQSHPFICVEELEPHPHHSSWRKTYNCQCHISCGLYKKGFWSRELFLVGIFVAIVASCNNTWHGKRGQNIMLASRFKETLCWSWFLTAKLSLNWTILMSKMKYVQRPSSESDGKITGTVFRASWDS